MRPTQKAFGILALTATLSLSAAPPLAAQQIDSPYRFIDTRQDAGVFFGVLTMDAGSAGLGPTGGTFFGGRYGIDVSGPFAVEGGIGYASATRDVLDPSASEAERKVGEADVALMLLDARIRFSLTGQRTWNRLSPHVFAGGGAVFDMADPEPFEEGLAPEDRFDFENSFAGVLGVGARFFPSDRLMVRGDLALNLWKVSTPGGWLTTEREEEFGILPEEEWVGNWGFTFGAALTF